MIKGNVKFRGELHPKFMGKLPLTQHEVRMNKMLSSMSEKSIAKGHELGLMYRGRMPDGWTPQPRGLRGWVFYLTKMWWRQFV